MESNIFTVAEITGYLKDIIQGDPVLNDLRVTGEISNFHHHNSGHMYFTLKDDKAQLKAVMFKSKNCKLKFEPEDGLKVNAHGYLSLYEPRGTYQLNVTELEPAGKGALYLAFEQLKEKLENEGLFAEERKKPIPLLPRKIGVVTSPTGAAIRDILSVAKRRFDNVSVLIYPSHVQGELAAGEIVKGIEYLDQREDIDLIIVSRGGGSIEDLWPFNEEIVARAIYQCQTPVISGVGHETDFTIADFVADLRAPTPSAAAERAVASRIELENYLNNLLSRLKQSIGHQANQYRERINAFSRKRIFTSPEELFANQIQQIDELGQRMEWSIDKIITRHKERFNFLNGKLESLSPLKTLQRGYSVTYKEGKVITSTEKVEQNDLLKIRLHDGLIHGKVLNVEKDGEVHD